MKLDSPWTVDKVTYLICNKKNTFSINLTSSLFFEPTIATGITNNYFVREGDIIKIINSILNFNKIITNFYIGRIVLFFFCKQT